MNKQETYIVQITSGRGPAECCLLVAKAVQAFLAEARNAGFSAELLSREPGPMGGTLYSGVIELKGRQAETFLNGWEGVILWVNPSPYRIYHKRKNWFAGVHVQRQSDTGKFDANRVRYQTLKASGPGGQHVNKTESAVRAIDSATGIAVTVSDSRSQWQNRKLALQRLQEKVMQHHRQQAGAQDDERWQKHNELERGNPIRVYRGRKFQLDRKRKEV